MNIGAVLSLKFIVNGGVPVEASVVFFFGSSITLILPI